MTTILVTGANGQLGHCLKAIYDLGELPPVIKKSTVHFLNRKDMDMASSHSIKTALDKYKPAFVINAAAYTAVDNAENEIDLAKQVNHLAVKELADACKAVDCRLIHVSTDFVFKGDKSLPYREEDETQPLGVYGESKLLGEKAVMASGAQYAIVRTSWLYSEYRKNFVKTMLRLAEEKDELNIVSDQIGSPTYARDLAVFLWELVARPEDVEAAVYHYANEGACTWYDLAKASFMFSGVQDLKVNAITTKDFPTPAKRPSYSVLSTEKIKSMGFRTQWWQNALLRCLAEIEDED